MTHAVYALALMMVLRLPVTVAAANNGATYPLVYVNNNAPRDWIFASGDVREERGEHGRGTRGGGERKRAPAR